MDNLLFRQGFSQSQAYRTLIHSNLMRKNGVHLSQYRLNFFPEPQGHGSGDADGRMPQDSKVSSGSRQRHQVRSDHIGNPAYLCVAPQVVHGAAALTPVLTQGFQGHVKPDLVAVFKTVVMLLATL
jgi:hypothetical protein